MITVVNYGMGNLGSILNMFKKIGAEAKISGDKEEVLQAEKLLLPGVGAFDTAMKELKNRDLIGVLNQKVLEEKVPVLGICLGMQLLTKGSDEGKLDGLGWIDAYTHKFQNIGSLKVPHMGWNEIKESNPSALTTDLDKASENSDQPRFYFVHSYHVKVTDEKNSILKCNYGLEFDAAIQRDNIMGCQFHPEKSHKFGMKLLSNFTSI